MPAIGVPNNPDGVNSWSGFGNEEPYGQATKNQQLQQAAPLAGGPVASGPIAAPQRASRRARGASTPAPSPGPPPVAPEVSPDALLAQRWQAIAQIPGASPLVQEYAQAALARLNG